MRLRLWPVAVLLVAALVAVPFLLTRDAEPVAAPVAADARGVRQGVRDTLAEPVVAAGRRPRTARRRRRVLGARKDPFQPAPAKKPKKAKRRPRREAPTVRPTADSASAPSRGHAAPVTTPPCR